MGFARQGATVRYLDIDAEPQRGPRRMLRARGRSRLGPTRHHRRDRSQPDVRRHHRATRVWTSSAHSRQSVDASTKAGILQLVRTAAADGRFTPPGMHHPRHRNSLPWPSTVSSRR